MGESQHLQLGELPVLVALVGQVPPDDERNLLLVELLLSNSDRIEVL